MKNRLRQPLLLLLQTLFSLSVILLFGTVHAKDNKQCISKNERQFLVETFISNEFDREFLESIFHDPKLTKYEIVVSKNIYNKESRRNYDDFHNAYSFKLAKRFIRKWQSVLDEASKKFDVDKEVLVSILLVETGLGNVLGKYPVIAVFSSILIEYNHRNTVADNAETLSSERSFELQRLEEKAQWAENELKALLTIVKSTSQNPFHFKGSFAGAFGIPQFLPSSYVKWGYDSDQNGTVNLFLVPDAIYSTANYLRAHGWKKGLYLESNKDVIFKYNHSDIYVETVLEIAKKIKVAQTPDSKSVSEQTRLNQNRKARNEKFTS